MPIDKIYVEHVKTLLTSLPKQSVIDLARTVTCQRIHFDSVNEAISAIIDFSQSPKELLCRRRMTCDYLFAYLVNHCQSNVPFKSVKRDLVDKILEIWHADGQSAGTSGDSDYGDDSPDGAGGKSGEDRQTGGETGVTESPEMKALASAFLTWWYSLLKPVAGCAPVDSQASAFGPQHFFGDAALHLYCMSEDGRFNYEEHITSAARVFSRLCEIISTFKLLLNPNVTSPSSIKCFSDPYGLVFIGVMGTLFVSSSLQSGDSTLAGVFEQSFGIVQDPLRDNNWVVKFSQLRLSIDPRFRPMFEHFFNKPIYELPNDNDRPAIMEI